MNEKQTIEQESISANPVFPSNPNNSTNLPGIA